MNDVDREHDLAALMDNHKEPHQIYVITIVASEKHAKVVCLCGKEFSAETLDKAEDRFWKHYKGWQGYVKGKNAKK